ncbi:hypothetical protein C8R44DRAFT_753062 [Mycena epipterygia]|nr:hypothetical protein C8R44DRAFT_753512 [Mycena epipterygia]KAJ7084995.1 hypothetical protein C8R44DRAFT_753062 [Mycena epipterygia]
MNAVNAEAAGQRFEGLDIIHDLGEALAMELERQGEDEGWKKKTATRCARDQVGGTNILHVVWEVAQYLAELALDSVLVRGEPIGHIEVYVHVNSEDVGVNEEESLLDKKVTALLAGPVLNHLQIQDQVIRRAVVSNRFSREETSSQTRLAPDWRLRQSCNSHWDPCSVKFADKIQQGHHGGTGWHRRQCGGGGHGIG